jgi:hypothetical protein
MGTIGRKPDYVAKLKELDNISFIQMQFKIHFKNSLIN